MSINLNKKVLCPKCQSANCFIYKNGNGLRCKDCDLVLGPFENPNTLKGVIKMWERKRENINEQVE